MKVLIADDDPQLLRALRITFGAHGYDILTAPDGATALRLAAERRPDLYIIDLGMPRLDGVALIEAIRGWSHAPILVLSGRTDSVQKVRALDAGADDYVVKPFAIDELLARLRALSRRVLPVGARDEPVVRFADITVDLTSKTVTRTDNNGTGHPVRLTPTEWAVLEILIRHEGRLISRQQLLSTVWGTDHVKDTGYLRLYVSQLRKKLEPDPTAPQHLLTEPGMGYRFTAAPATGPAPQELRPGQTPAPETANGKQSS